jgi:2'-5' RNA ligase
MSATGADLKVVEKENLHFTVKFLGEISEVQASEASTRLKGLSLRGAEVGVRGVGAFPSISRPRVVWAGVAQSDQQSITPLANTVITALDGIGERDKRPFQAHITLGRVRSERNVRQLERFLHDNSDMSFGLARLTELKLKSSQLTPGGPIYRDIGVYPLA